jgi:peptide/nickel transport system ATP-binding protein
VSTPILEARGIRKRYGRLAALDGVSIRLGERASLGLVGESGSGKSTLVKCVLGLVTPDEGVILYRGKPVRSKADRKAFARRVGVVFQEPLASLDPRRSVRQSVLEPFAIHGFPRGEDREALAAGLLGRVELPEMFLDRFPHQLSGGECQRVAIARALALEPELLVCDEAVSALDAVTRARILNLLLKIQSTRPLAILFVSHDMRVVRHLCDDVLVLKDGRAVEEGSVGSLFDAPKHPYTCRLLQAAGLLR